MVKLVIKKILQQGIKKSATHLIACGEQAGKWLYGSGKGSGDFEVVFNGIEVAPFAYNANLRTALRTQLNIPENAFVIGHVGRLNYPKNQPFIINIFRELSKNDPTAVLLIAGEGSLKAELQEQIEAFGLQDRAYLLGLRSDVPALMSTFDVMMMPSHYEGFPVTVLEAQAASLPCVLSTNISQEVAVVENLVKFLPLDAPMAQWINALEGYKATDRTQEAGATQLTQKGYDSTSMVARYAEIYSNKYSKK